MVICTGDLNINLNETNNKTQLFNWACNRHGMENIANFLTRITNMSQTKIDVVLTNKKERMKCKTLNNERITDHETIQISLTCKEKINFKLTKTVNSWKNYDKIQLINDLRNWINFEYINTNEKIKMVQNNIKNSVDPMIQKVQIKLNSNAKKWYDEETKIQKIKKIEKYNVWTQTRDTNKWYEYIEERNKYNKMVKEKKNNNTQNDIIKAGKNQKHMWMCLKKLLPSRMSEISNEIEFENGMTSTNSTEICEKFNEYFIDSIIKINREIPKENAQINITRNEQIFKFKPTNIETITKITKKFTKKVDKNNTCNSMVWNDAMEYIAYHMKTIINESLASGKFPDELKTTITPIPKIRNTKKINEFRPINGLPIEEKIIEGVVKEQLQEYIESNDILTENQSAYRRNHSCETALNLLISECKEAMDKGYVIVLVFLDLKRAYETVDRKITIEKLKCYGINGTELNWFDTYMTNRTQIVKYKSEMSKKKKSQLDLHREHN